MVMARISGGTLASALLPMAIGLVLGTIGQEAVTGETRYTFGFPIWPRASRWCRSWSGSTASPN